MKVVNNVVGNGAIAQSIAAIAEKYPMTLFNCAGIPHPHLVSKESIKRENAHINHIIELSKDYDRLVHISTPAVLGHLSTPYDEVAKYEEGATAYGLQKRQNEQTLRDRIYQKLTIVRLFSFVSIKLRKQIIYDTIMKLKAGDGVFYISDCQRRCFVSEADFLKMMRFALDNKMQGTLNFTNSESTNLIEAVNYISKKLDYSGDLMFHSNSDTENYPSLISTTSRLFDSGYRLENVGLRALDEVITFHENFNI